MLHLRTRPIFTLISLALLAYSQFILACEPAVYSLSSEQLSFPAVTIEMYQPYTDITDGTYTLCTGKGAAIVMDYVSLGDFHFPDNPVPGAEVECNQVISSQDNCYPTYSNQSGQLTFPEVKVPWQAILPTEESIEVGGTCYQVSMKRGLVRSDIFTLTQVKEITCQP